MGKKRANQSEWFTRFDKSLWLKDDDTGKDEASFIKRALRLRKGQSALDAPCGAGRIAVHLAKAGCLITGLDLRPTFITRAKLRFRKEGLSGSFKVMDLRQLDYDGTFHAVFNWFGSFGYFSDAENLDLLRGYAIALRPGGRLLIDQSNRENILRHFRHSDQRGEVKMSTKWQPETQCVETVWTCNRQGESRSCRSSIRLYTPAQFRQLFGRVGLEIESLYDSEEGGEYRRASRRISVIGRKK